ncbi:MAG: hypothetical protein WC481_08475 [Candidatus Omnitrophota bacterium]
MENFYIKAEELFWIVQDIAGSLVTDTVTVSIKRLSDGYTWDFTELEFENAVNTGTPTFITDILWKTSFTPPTEDTYIVTFNDTTTATKHVQVLVALGGDEAVSFSSKSEVKIANLALTGVGASRITSLTEDSQQARVVSEMYAQVRDEVLRSHPWNFAVDRATLSILADAPAFEYSYQFQLPVNCLRVLGAYDSSGDKIEDYKVEGRKLLCDDSAVYIKYIKRVTDANEYDANFITLFGVRLSAEIAFPIANSASLGQNKLEMYGELLRIAKGIDAQESSSIETSGDDTWEKSRE